MNGSSHVGQAGGVAALVAVAALGAVTVLAGTGAPATEAPAPAAGAAFEPGKVTLVAVRSWWPFEQGENEWTAEEPVRIRANELAAVAKLAQAANGRLASGDGDQLDVRLVDATVQAGRITASVRADGIPRAGEYIGTLSLDPLNDKAAAVELAVKARHHWLWPLVVLFVGVAIGVGGTAVYEARRRQIVLRATLIEIAEWLRRAPPVEDLHDLRKELLGDDLTGSASPGCKDCKKSASPPIVELSCRVRKSWLASTLDRRTEEVETIRTRAELWHRAAEAVRALRTAESRLAAAGPRQVIQEDAALLAQVAESLQTTHEPVVDGLTAQAEVVNALAAAREAWEAAKRPGGLDPAKTYADFEPADKRKPEDSRRLVGRLRELQLRIVATAQASLVAPAGGAPDGAPSLVPGPAQPPAPIPPPAWLPDGAGCDAGGLLGILRVFDAGVFLVQLVVAGLAFLLPIYAATNFGTIEQYLAVFTAGFLGKVVLDQTVTLIRDVRPTQSKPRPAPE